MNSADEGGPLRCVHTVWVANTRLKVDFSATAEERVRFYRPIACPHFYFRERLCWHSTWLSRDCSSCQVCAFEGLQGIFRMLIEILRKEGFRGWLAGIVPALVLVLNPAIQFALYDHLRAKVVQLKQVRMEPSFCIPQLMQLARKLQEFWRNRTASAVA